MTFPCLYFIMVEISGQQIKEQIFNLLQFMGFFKWPCNAAAQFHLKEATNYLI